ncbi:GH92 family glycosyl hydrolase [Amycolatopsis thermophila]|uniref:Alpha-1,2-mannosidase n=1 Tax=Amycolatopsis thermophila TaxID=206084 RepID=A0ABU0F253_9PSEU|nr:GH92 family glycosyl hydrolase [Amycolatopsis thermophila]MDQ0381665.1 putative alpha-1,2-mannosidase [Amycolatopsis thermophila]
MVRTIRVLVAALLITGMVTVPPAGAQQPARFSSSFEAGEPAPDWADTVETGPDGAPRAAGVNGANGSAIPGDVRGKATGATASAENTGAGEVAVNVLDGRPESKWLAFASSGWVQAEFAEPVAITRYGLTSANDAPERDPRDWTLQGSDDGTTWTTLDTQSGQTFGARFEARQFRLATPATHRFYRLDISANHGADIVQLAELLLADDQPAPPPLPAMRSYPDSGPPGGYTSKPRAGFTGLRAFHYGGTQTARHGYSWNKVFDVRVPVRPDTELSYKVFPELTGDDLKYPSTNVAVDLAFTDGTYLSDLGALDQYGFPLTPRGQGAAKSLYANQWNLVRSAIGTVARGKTVARVLVAYDNPDGPGAFNGWFDDIQLAPAAPRARVDHLSDHVLTTRGTNANSTFSRGNNFPATAVPHGFNFWTPVTDAGSMNWLYRYHEGNNAQNLPTMQALALSHEPSPWMGDRQTFQVMPSAAGGVPDAGRAARALPFRHENETARPYFYGVTFDNGIRAELTPADHAAMFRFTFPGPDANLVFDNINDAGGLTLDPASGTLSGFTDVRSGNSAGAGRMFVYASFDRPVTGGSMLPGDGRDHVRGYLRFDPARSGTVTMRIATSLISLDQAKRNLEQEIPAGTAFDTVRSAAQAAWDRTLGVIEVEGASQDQLTTLYSNLYRLFLYPNSGFENVGTTGGPRHAYASPVAPKAGPDTPTRTGSKVVDGEIYVNNGFWDTYRTTWPAYSLLSPDMAGKMIDGFVQQYRDGGWIARWSSPGYANLMTGTSSDVAFADAYLKGVRGFDVQAAYDAAIKNATVAPPDENVGRKGLEQSIFLGYTPASTGEGMSWALEGYLNDFGIAMLARKLADEAAPDDPRRREYAENAEYFSDRAQNYVHMFDPAAGFFQGRDSSGRFRVPAGQYDPRAWGYDYTETDGWNMAFTVPQDGQGLANLYGGREALGRKLDQFFATPETAGFPGAYGGQIHEMREARDVRMGQYGHSNQPSHHILYMYDYAGQPAKTQAGVREALSRLYLGSELGQGYAGDEDNGEMSAWYVFGALGFYPLRMGSPEYAVGSPLFTKATVHLPGGRDLVVNAPKNSARNVYVQGLRVNGKPWSSTSLPHDLLARGATLDFAMGPNPSNWGTGAADVPPSLTHGDEVPQPPADLTTPGGPLFDNTSATDARPLTTVDCPVGGTVAATFYTLTSGAAAGDPRGWVLEGSADGQSWTTLDTRSGETFPWRRQTRAFKIATPGAYAHYRLRITDSTGGAPGLSEVELLGGK